MLFAERDAAAIADLMMGGDASNIQPINDIALSALGEAMNQMMGSAATSMSAMISTPTQVGLPRYPAHKNVPGFGQQYLHAAQDRLR